MSGERCTECKVGTLSSFFESRLTVCADCAAKLIEQALVLRGELPKMTQRLREAHDTIARYTVSVEAEEKGFGASKKGFGLDQNPYKENELAQCWTAGWCRGELERRAEQAASVIQWSVLNLDAIEELAKGYGQQEIADKLSTVSAKLVPFVEVE